MQSSISPAISLQNLKFAWDNAADLLAIPSLTIEKGQHVFLKGPSGSGKSTLLGLISGILSPSSGDISILGQSFPDLSKSQKDSFRANHIGIIFQQFNLLPYLSVGENILLPCHFSKKRKEKTLSSHNTIDIAARTILSDLGLDVQKIWKHPVNELSVGQQQRVAVARALIGNPDIIIADEPTSSLDLDARDSFIDVLKKQSHLSHSTLLFVSHDDRLMSHFDQTLDLNALNQASV